MVGRRLITYFNSQLFYMCSLNVLINYLESLIISSLIKVLRGQNLTT